MNASVQGRGDGTPGTERVHCETRDSELWVVRSGDWEINLTQLKIQHDEAHAEAERLRGVIREAHFLLAQREGDRARALLSSSINLYGEHLTRALSRAR